MYKAYKTRKDMKKGFTKDAEQSGEGKKRTCDIKQNRDWVGNYKGEVREVKRMTKM